VAALTKLGNRWAHRQLAHLASARSESLSHAVAGTRCCSDANLNSVVSPPSLRCTPVHCLSCIFTQVHSPPNCSATKPSKILVQQQVLPFQLVFMVYQTLCPLYRLVPWILAHSQCG
jgi:hypothetical protein